MSPPLTGQSRGDPRMRVNARALLSVAGVSCLYESEAGSSCPARLAMVTEETVRAARDMVRSDPALRTTDASPQLRYGGALAYVDGGDGPAQRLILSPGEGDEFRLPCGMRFLGRHMLTAEKALADRGEGEGPFLRSLIRSVFSLVSSVPDPDRFPEHLIAQAYRSSLRDAFGEARLPIGDEALVLKCRSDLIRSRISALDPKHPDALGAATPLARILDGAGLDVRSDGVQVSGVGRVTRFEARRLMETGPYRRGLFDLLTKTPTARIEGVVLPADDVRMIETALPGSRLSGAWVDAVQQLVNELTGSGRGGYRLTLGVHAAQGLDLLVMTDTIGEANGISLLFSWPSHERAPVLGSAEGPVYALCPQEVPTSEEVIRLERVLQEISPSDPPSIGQKQALDA